MERRRAARPTVQHVGGPTVEVRLDLDAIRENARRVQSLVGRPVHGVVKGVDAHPAVVEALIDAGIDTVAVSRVDHLRALRDRTVDVAMVRTPAVSEIDAVVELADLTLHGSVEVLERAAVAAERRGSTHRVVLMVDAGAGREGVDPRRAATILETVEGLRGIEVHAIGVNLGCFGSVPDPRAVHRVVDRLDGFGYPLSVGGSGMVLVRDALPDAVAAYRIGDAILTGKWTDTPVEELQQGAVELRAEVLTNRAAESVVYVGDAVADPRCLRPKGGFTIQRWSNEQTVIDERVPVGEVVAFEMEYGAIATAFQSHHV